jgi:hypothetical protein
VLADGTLHHVDAASAPDLFWAMRGAGGGNFGVSTAFTFQLRPVGPLTTFNSTWPPGKQVELMIALQAMQQQHARIVSTRSKVRPLVAGANPRRDSLVVETLGLSGATPAICATSSRPSMQSRSRWRPTSTKWNIGAPGTTCSRTIRTAPTKFARAMNGALPADALEAMLGG